MIGTTGQPIHLPTPQPGTDQVTHPSVVWVPEGWNGHPYWMAATPYDGTNAQYENPCIYFSDDGLDWTPLPGNPIAPAPAGGHNSDTHLVRDGDRLVCVWREVVSRTYERLRTAVSDDGSAWLTGPTIYSGAQFTEHLSPSLVRVDNGWLLFSVQRVVSGPNKVRRFAASSLEGPWVEQECVGLVAPDGREPWHLWVGLTGDGWHALLNDTDLERSGGRGNLYHSRSVDGRAWTEPTVCLPSYGAWHDSLYQACAVWRCGGLDVWYSGVGPQWRVGLTRLEPHTGGKLSFGILASAHVPYQAGGYTAPTLLNSWVNYGSGYQEAGYVKTASDVVISTGLVKDGTATTGAYTLPTGHRPGTTDLLVRYDGTTNVHARLDVESDGTVKPHATNDFVSVHWLFPDGATWTAPTMLNSWVNYDGGFTPAEYTKVNGTVYVHGLIKSGTTTAGTSLFALPANHRPDGRELFPSISNSGAVRIDVYSDGTVAGLSNLSATWTSVQLNFPDGATWTAPTLLNSWANYGSGFSNAGYTKDSDGIVHLRGLIKNGTTTLGTVIFTLPEGYRPLAPMRFPVVRSNSVVGAIEVDDSGNVKAINTNATYTSLSGVSFYAG